MSVALVMPSLSDDSQGRNAQNGKLARHTSRRRILEDVGACKKLEILDCEP